MGWQFRKRLVMIAIVVLALSGARASAEPPPAVTVSADKFSKEVTFLGPIAGVNPFGGTSRFVRIRSWLDRETKISRHQLYVTIGYISQNWRFYDTAADDHANALTFTNIDRDAGSCGGFSGCIFDETAGFAVPDQTLRERAETGFQVKVSAHSGDFVILNVTSAQIKAQLAAIDGYGAPAPQEDKTAPIIAAPPSFGADLGNSWGLFGMPSGALIVHLTGDGVAKSAGLRWADSVIEWNGHRTVNADELKAELAKVGVGQLISFKALRGRSIIDMKAQF